MAPHVAHALAGCSVIENGQAAVAYDDSRQADAALRPSAVFSVEHDGLMFWIPVIRVLGPIDPDGIGKFLGISLDGFRHVRGVDVRLGKDADVVGEEEPVAVGRLVVEVGILDLVIQRRDWLRIERPGSVEVLGAGDS